VSAGESPAQAREILTERQSRLERILLLTRLSCGCPLTELDQAGADAARTAVADGLAEPEAYQEGRVVLTRRGRLLADAVVRDLTG
jgi:oxygen-independent coproporphyrinogen-3 oxidase